MVAKICIVYVVKGRALSAQRVCFSFGFEDALKFVPPFSVWRCVWRAVVDEEIRNEFRHTSELPTAIDDCDAETVVMDAFPCSLAIACGASTVFENPPLTSQITPGRESTTRVSY